MVGNGKGTIHDATNDIGHRLCQLDKSLNMACLTAKFDHRRKHKVTWIHSAENTKNKIDHILITGAINRETTDASIYKGVTAELITICSLQK